MSSKQSQDDFFPKTQHFPKKKHQKILLQKSAEITKSIKVLLILSMVYIRLDNHNHSHLTKKKKQDNHKKIKREKNTENRNSIMVGYQLSQVYL